MDQIKERILKLLALARDAGATEHEAALALAKAQQLAAQHALDLESMQAVNTGPNIVVDRSKEIYQNRPYVIHLASAAAELYFGQALFRNVAGELAFTWVGTPDNIQFAKATFEWLYLQTETWYKQELPRGLSVSRRAQFRRNFKWACSLRLRSRVKEMKLKLPSGSRALVVVDTLRAAADDKVR